MSESQNLTSSDIETIERALDETNYPPETKLWVDAHAALKRIERVIEAAGEFVGPHDWAGCIGGPDIAATQRAHRLVEAVKALDA